MEVSQVARTIARCLGLNEDLCETLSLAHDLGHTPFGHAGEDVLDKYMEEFGGFDHNIQTIRILTLLENKYFNFVGLNLSIETVDGLIKHNGPPNDLFRFNNILKLKYFKNKIIFKNFPSLEAQIASISDDIAYNNHDLEDGLRAGLFSVDDLSAIPYIGKLIKKNIKDKKKYRREIIVNQIVRKLISNMVNDVIKNTEKNIKEKKILHTNDIYKQNQFLVDFSPTMKKIVVKIKDFLKHNMYNHKKVISNTNKCKIIVRDLFLYLIKNPNKFIDNSLFKNQSKERVVADFIAGMTDRYAIKLHKNIK
tara:strand:+ start:100 stop:1023 length:924 start_codon:yes stop_codon:yes gene_type:complete